MILLQYRTRDRCGSVSSQGATRDPNAEISLFLKLLASNQKNRARVAVSILQYPPVRIIRQGIPSQLALQSSGIRKVVYQPAAAETQRIPRRISLRQ